MQFDNNRVAWSLRDSYYDNEDSELNFYAILAMGLQGNMALARKCFGAAKKYLSNEHRNVLSSRLSLL
mgnify:CR=1 FL=1|jgi:hypothetical protein